ELNWDLTFLRRALGGDSSLALDVRVRERSGWRGLDKPGAGTPSAADLRGLSVILLDGVAPSEVSAEFDAAVAAFVPNGGAGGGTRYRAGKSGADLGLASDGMPARSAAPLPTAEGRDLTAWDEDAARGERAWRTAAPLADVGTFRLGGGDRVLLAAADNGTAV